MSSNTRQSFWVLVGSISQLLLSVGSAAILSRLLDKTEYGTYRQVLYVYNTLLLFFTIGFPRIVSIYLPKYDIIEGKSFVRKIFYVLFVLGLIFSLFLYFGAQNISSYMGNNELKRGVRAFSIVPAFLLPTMCIEGVFATYKKTIYLASYSIITKICGLCLIIIPVVFISKSYIYAVYGWCVYSVVSFLLLLIFLRIPFKGIVGKKVSLSYLEMFFCALPLLLASVAEVLTRAASPFFVSRYFGPGIFAEYSNGFIELPFANMVINAVAVVLLPSYVELFNGKGEVGRVAKLINSSVIKSTYLIYPITVYFMFMSTQAVELIYSNRYLGSSKYFALAMVVNIFNVVAFAPILLALGKTREIFIGHAVSALVSWFLCLISVYFWYSPLAYATIFVFVAVCRNIIFVHYTLAVTDIAFSEAVPLKKMLIILIHCCFVMIFVSILFRFIPIETSLIPQLIISFVIYIIILVISGSKIGADYIEFLGPILRKR